MRTSSRNSALFDRKSGFAAAWAAVWQLVPDTSCFWAITGRTGVPESARIRPPHARERVAANAVWADGTRRDIGATPFLRWRSARVRVASTNELYRPERVMSDPSQRPDSPLELARTPCLEQFGPVWSLS